MNMFEKRRVGEFARRACQSFLSLIPGVENGRRVRTPTVVAGQCGRFGGFVERLECRAMLSTGPVITDVQVQGPLTSINALVLTFSEPLDPTTAQNLQAYSFGKPPPPNPSDNSGISLSDFLPFRRTGHEKPAAKRVKLTKHGRINFASAVYDSTADTVTLTPLAPFSATKYFKYLHVKGTGPNAIEDMTGNALNSGNDIVTRWTHHHGKTIRYHDTDHDNITFKLTGPGKLDVFYRGPRHRDPVIFISGATSATVVTGTLVNAGTILPVVNIAELEGSQGVSNNLFNNPRFNVQSTWL